ncbi:MAG: tandem-95 repeat protein [Myxococcaceae bacterium]|nr:tandem-95 repeat protein [Myxococcaceae bacterium]
MDEPVPGAPAYGDQLNPEVASNGTDYLVVWMDQQPGGVDIRGVRVSSAGQVLDTGTFAISTGAGDLGSPVVASNGTDYLVVWTEQQPGGADLRGARVSSAGQVLDTEPLALSTQEGTQYQPAVVSDGTGYLVVWTDVGVGEVHIRGTRVSSAGQVLDTPALALSTASGYGGNPSVAFNGTDYLVVWDVWSGSSSFMRDIQGARVSREGQVLDAGGISISSTVGDQHSPSVASDGAGFLVVWRDVRNGKDYDADIYGARVSGVGEVLDPSGLRISTTSRNELSAEVVSRQGRYLVAWSRDQGSSQDMAGAWVDGEGTVLGQLELVAGTEGGAPRVASGGAGFFLVWSEYLFDDKDVFGARVGETGEVLDAPGLLLSTAANPQAQPAMASNGTDYLVVWTDRRGESWDLYGTRVSATGEVLDPAGIVISTAVGSQKEPAVASDGTDYFVAWTDGRTNPDSIHGARVSSAGQVLDADGVLLFAGAERSSLPRVASNGTGYLVAWEVGGGIRWARVSGDAKVLEGNALPPATAGRLQAQPAVASNGEGYLVLWQEVSINGKPPLWDVWGARMSGGGGVLDASGIRISSSPTARGPLAVTSDGVGYFVAWSESYDIVGARVSGAGEVLDPGGIPISTGASTQRSPAVARVGGGYLVVWEDFRAGNDDVYGRWVSGDGRVAGPSEIPFATGPHDETTPAVASSGSPRSLVAYSNFVEPPDLRTRRVLGRLVSLEQPLAFMQSASTQEDEPLALVLGGAHPEGLPLTFQVVSAPAHGSLAGSPPELTYTPGTDFHGEDGFTFSVSDGQRTSEPVTVSLAVTPVNDAPVAEAQTVVVPVGSQGAVVLTGSDVEGDALSFTLTSQPGEGTLLGTPPVLAYTPPEGFRGTTTFTFTVSDGVATSAPATVTLIVGEEPSSPSPGGCDCAAGSPGGASAAGLLLALLGLRARSRPRCPAPARPSPCARPGTPPFPPQR